MMPVERLAFKFILQLHPPSFRERFGQEMLLDYTDMQSQHAFLSNVMDATLSLVKQWLKTALEVQPTAEPVSSTFLTGQVAVAFVDPFTPYEVFKGFLLSVLLFSTFWYVEYPMRANLGPALFSSVRALWTLSSAAPERRTPTRIVIEDVTVLELKTGRLFAHKNVVIEEGMITTVENSTTHDHWTNADVVDGRGKFLMPGMWDMHSHITHTEVDFPLYIANGVLGIRNMGGVQQQVFAWDAKLKDGSLFGPLAFVSGPILDGPGGPVEPKSYGVFIANADQARAEVKELKSKQADFIKVYDGLSRESYFAIANESKKVGLPFAGHVPNDVTILEAVRAGQRSIEHGIEHRGESTAEEQLIQRGKTNNFMAEAMRTKNFTLIPEGIAAEGNIWLRNFSQNRADALYRALAQSGTYLCPTLVVERWGAYGDEIAAQPDARQQYIDPKTLVYWQPSMNMLTKYRTPAYKQWFKDKYAKLQEQLPKQQALGVQLLAGTDLTVPFTYPGSSVHDEVRLFAAAGLTPLEALQTATTHPVEFFGLQQSLGSVTVGKKAELVLLNGNPLGDLNNLDRIEAVVSHKRVIRRAELDQMMARAALVASTNK